MGVSKYAQKHVILRRYSCKYFCYAKKDEHKKDTFYLKHVFS